MPDDREWAEFLDRLVHDLREPLRSVHAFSELLQETATERLGAAGEEAIGEILSGTTRIRSLAEGISGYTLALREGTDASAPQQGSLQLAFELVIDALQSQISAMGASVTAEGLPRLNVSLERLMQLLENLIGNSLKFRGETPPDVRVSAAPDPDGWTIRVEDNGIGIDSVDSATIFQPFTRIHGRKYPGVGLGLAACRQIVAAHRGEIRMDPRPGGGSICTFWLPSA
jgi:signal transduction histidine kinase